MNYDEKGTPTFNYSVLKTKMSKAPVDKVYYLKSKSIASSSMKTNVSQQSSNRFFGSENSENNSPFIKKPASIPKIKKTFNYKVVY